MSMYAALIQKTWQTMWEKPLRLLLDNVDSVTIVYGKNHVGLTVRDVELLTDLLADHDAGDLAGDRAVSAKILKAVGFMVDDGELFWRPTDIDVS